MLADVLYDLFSTFIERVVMRLIRGARLLVIMFLGLLWRAYERAARPRTGVNGRS